MAAPSQDGVSHIVVVRYLHTVEEDHIFQLGRVAHNAVIPNQHIAANIRTGAHLGTFANDAGTNQRSCRSYRSTASDPHLRLKLVIQLWIQRFTDLANGCPDLIQRFPGIGRVLKQRPSACMREVVQITDCQHAFFLL